ncbi:Clp protease N-terminal domain-containing protein [Streptomyces sp. NPDC005963]|uniref:Clp protease N-terminal domain-containing protein n=1 Tax=Streptomyces sp. NPDC005963 TaxID=3156721 RepID=UPI0033C4457F
MQSPPSRLPRQSTARRAERDAPLTAELVSAVAGARRRAVRDGDRQLDTAHLLHSLIEADPEVRGALGSAPRVARVLGYLVQRSIGYGLRWQGSVEDSGALPVSGAPPPPSARAPRPIGWSPSAHSAMEAARRRAVLRGRDRACGMDLLMALTSDPDCRAVEVLNRAGVDTQQLNGHAGAC